jgi:hypothetical protein
MALDLVAIRTYTKNTCASLVLQPSSFYRRIADISAFSTCHHSLIFWWLFWDFTLKKIFALCLVPYAFWLVFAYHFHFIDWLNLFIHEGGHFLFTFFGEWLHMLGGTIAQLLVPLAIALYFLYRHEKYASAFCGLWFGESMMYMAQYMGDAQDQLLPLLGGGIHDWNWMFSRMGLLSHCKGIALFFHVMASIIVLVSVAYMLYDSFKRRERTPSPI